MPFETGDYVALLRATEIAAFLTSELVLSLSKDEVSVSPALSLSKGRTQLPDSDLV